ncbi:hypothetical protein MERGE_000504 [Pneumocystis wakefieldiae]|uniref:DASH complex subunit DAD4 n=1 Tax=Pneumocystis wakefieldiae TaxID=38082 RepID=A0A899G3U8_9ASCO|nr:hypothetical protein MERGE_000504 [Pneumocystis wakefieldiae]
MENPHEEQQNALMARIVMNVEKLNEAIMEFNRCIQEINMANMNLELISQIWANYGRNVRFHLEGTNHLEKPL